MKVNVEADLSKYTKYINFKNFTKVAWYGFCIITGSMLLTLPLLLWAFNVYILSALVSQTYPTITDQATQVLVMNLYGFTRLLTYIVMVISLMMFLVFVAFVSNPIIDRIKEFARSN
jgi:sterol desaturase/sphingolipid hydroxylase (fatty acid hydroxylase superfamily)